MCCRIVGKLRNRLSTTSYRTENQCYTSQFNRVKLSLNRVQSPDYPASRALTSVVFIATLSTMKSIVLSTLTLAILTCLSYGETPKKDPWPDKAAERFKGKPTADHKAEIEANLPSATAKPKKARKVLCFWRCEGFIHTSIPFGNHAVAKMAETTGAYSVDMAYDYSVFTKENLAQYDAILFNNTTNLVPNEEQQAAIMEFIKGGKGIVGFHAASDNFKRWEEGIALIGGVFSGHPWNAGGTWAFKLDDPDHPLNAAFKGKGIWHKDEIYWYNPKNFQGRERLRVLMSLDMSKEENKKPLANEKHQKRVEELGGIDKIDVPVSWIREMGEGRLFYTNLGHNDMTFANRDVLQHMLDGIQYALGDIEADAVPSEGLKLEPVLAPAKDAQ